MRRMIGVFGGSPHPPEGNANLCPSCAAWREAFFSFSRDEKAYAACTWPFFDKLSRALGVLPGGNPDSNTLLSDMTTVVCLDDYHCLDRFGRKEKGVTALDPKAQDFDLMYEQVKDVRDNKPISKPIYNHVTGPAGPRRDCQAPQGKAPASRHPHTAPRRPMHGDGILITPAWHDVQTPCLPSCMLCPGDPACYAPVNQTE